MDTAVLLSSASTVDQPWALLEEALSEFEPDFKLQREQPSHALLDTNQCYPNHA